jgi:hypothetical protein
MRQSQQKKETKNEDMRHLELEKRNRTEYVDPTSAPH